MKPKSLQAIQAIEVRRESENGLLHPRLQDQNPERASVATGEACSALERACRGSLVQAFGAFGASSQTLRKLFAGSSLLLRRSRLRSAFEGRRLAWSPRTFPLPSPHGHTRFLTSSIGGSDYCSTCLLLSRPACRGFVCIGVFFGGRLLGLGVDFRSGFVRAGDCVALLSRGFSEDRGPER